MAQPNILIVEDESLIAEQLRVYLQLFGYTSIKIVNSGEQAIEIAEEFQPQLILMDVNLAGELDGIETARTIKSRVFTVVIFITAFSEDSVLERAKTVQPGSYLTKPIRKAELKANIETALYISDIEKRQRESEAERRQRARWLDATFQQASVGIINLDLDGLIIRANPRFCEIIGYERNKLLGTSPLDLTHPDFIQSSKSAVENLIQGKTESETSEKIYLRKNGSQVWVTVSSTMVRDENNDPEFLLNVVKDISDQKKAEWALRESEEKHRTLIDNIPQRVFFKNRNLEYVSANQRFADDLNLEKSAVINKTDFDLFSREFAEKYYEDDCKVLETGEIQQNQEYYTIDGARRNIISIRMPKKSETGEIEGIIGVFWDITEKIESEAETENLKQLLQKTQKMEAIGTLAGGIAHDFNNILHPIIGFSTLGIRATESNSSVHSYFETIHQAASRAKNLVKQILTFSRQNESELTPILLQPIIKEALKMLRSSLPSTIELKTEINMDCPPVKADATQIHQIIMNLATNAYHAMQETGGLLFVKLDRIFVSDQNRPTMNTMPGDYLQLTIKDTGTGIPVDMMEKIFDPYFTTKPIEKGTGLGLSVVQGILNNHDAQISVDSTPGEGTEFNVYFPTIEERLVELSVDSPQPEILGSERVLVVDDEEGIVFFQKEALEPLGYRVTGFNNSLEALDAFLENPDQFDIVVTDMTMPGLTGYALSLKILECRDDIPIILCTGYNEGIDEGRARQAGIRQFLIKPIDQDDLAAAIRKEIDS